VPTCQLHNFSTKTTGYIHPSTPSTTLTLAYSLGGGGGAPISAFNTLYAIVCYDGDISSDYVTSLTYDGVDLTFLMAAGDVLGAIGQEIWYLDRPTSLSGDVVVTVGSTMDICLTVCEFANSQYGPRGVIGSVGASVDSHSGGTGSNHVSDSLTAAGANNVFAGPKYSVAPTMSSLLSCLAVNMGTDLTDSYALSGSGFDRFVQQRAGDDFAPAAGNIYQCVANLVADGSADTATWDSTLDHNLSHIIIEVTGTWLSGFVSRPSVMPLTL
jgi:hypothetical protein